VRGAGQPEDAFPIDVPVQHESVVVGVGNVAPEFRHPGSTRPGILADLRTFELPLRVFRQRPPEAILIGTRCHVVDEDIVRIGDPVSCHRVVRRQQGVLADMLSAL